MAAPGRTHATGGRLPAGPNIDRRSAIRPRSPRPRRLVRSAACRRGCSHIWPTPRPIKQTPQSQLAKEMPSHQQRPPGTGVQDFDRAFLPELASQSPLVLFRTEKPVEQWHDSFERIPSSQIGDHLLLDLAVLAH